MTLQLAILEHGDAGLGAFERVLEESDVDCHRVRARQRRLPDALAFDGVVVLGGGLAAGDPRLRDARRWIRDAVVADVPVLGVGAGGQLLARALGADVTRGTPEVGLRDVFLTEAGAADPLFAGLPRRLRVLGRNEDRFELPRGAVPLAGSVESACEAFRYETWAYGLRFRLTHTTPEPDALATRLLERWLHLVAGVAALGARLSAAG